MTKRDDRDREVARLRSEMDLEGAEAREGRAHGAVVSVRLNPDEAARLREIASSMGLNLSQVLRRALEAYEAELAGHSLSLVQAFTFGGVARSPSTLVIRPEQPSVGESGTVQTRVREKVSA